MNVVNRDAMIIVAVFFVTLAAVVLVAYLVTYATLTLHTPPAIIDWCKGCTK